MMKFIKILLILLFLFNSKAFALGGDSYPRFTAGAIASDASQCASILLTTIGVYFGAKNLILSACITSKCLGIGAATTCAPTIISALKSNLKDTITIAATGGGSMILPGTAATSIAGACVKGAKISATLIGAATYAALFFSYQEWAKQIRFNSKVINTIDPAKCGYDNEGKLITDCCLAEGESKIEVGDGGEFSINGRDLIWNESGPLGDYCYKKEWDHTKSDNDHYNGGDGEIGISYKGEDPKWIKPNDCEVLTPDGVARHFCAIDSGDKICSEAVFCSTPVFVPGVASIQGYTGGGTEDLTKSRRDCGDNPYEEESVRQINDAANGRCPCACCANDKSSLQNSCSGVDVSLKSCKTFNEQYEAHCVEKPDGEATLLIDGNSPRTMSAYCDINTPINLFSSGDSDNTIRPFSFAGRSIRCFDKSLRNLFFNETDKDDQGNLIVGDPVCVGNRGDNGHCEGGVLNSVQESVQNIVTIMMILFIIGMGYQFLQGKARDKKYLFVTFFQFSLVLYFVNGDAWRDGYYNFLTKGAYELSSSFFVATVGAQESSHDIFADLTNGGEVSATVGQCQVAGVSAVTATALRESLSGCNFFASPLSENYEDGEYHYAILDTLDCKFAKYLGFEINNQFPQIIKSAVTMLFSTPSGIFFLFAAIYFFVYSIIFMLKVVFFLITALFMISLLIFISPITIPFLLLEKTRDMFNSWLTRLISYSIQPFIYLSFVAFVIALLDQFFTAFLSDIYDVTTANSEYEGFGVRIPVAIGSIDDSAVIVNLLKFSFLIYVLTALFDKITTIASSLAGAEGVASFIKQPGFEKMAKKAKEKLKKGGKKALDYAGSKASRGASAISDKVEERKEKKEEAREAALAKEGEEGGEKDDGDDDDAETGEAEAGGGDGAEAGGGDGAEAGGGDGAEAGGGDGAEGEKGGGNDV